MRDPLSVSPTILPQLDLTSLANQEGQIKYNIAEQGIEKQKKTDAYISGIADKINIKGKEWASKFGKLNLDAVNGLKGEYLSLIHKYKDYNDPELQKKLIDLNAKKDELMLNVQVQDEYKKLYDTWTKVINDNKGKNVVRKGFAKAVHDFGDLNSVEDMSNFMQDHKDDLGEKGYFLPQPIDVQPKINELMQGVKEGDTSGQTIRDANGNEITHTSKSYKQEVLRNIRRKSDEIYEQYKDKPVSFDPNTEEPITYGQKFKNSVAFFNNYLKDRLEPVISNTIKPDKGKNSIFNMSFGSGNAEHGYTPKKLDISYLEKGKANSMNVETGLSMPKDDAVELTGASFKNARPQTSEAEQWLDYIKDSGSKTFNPDYVFKDKKGHYWVSGAVSSGESHGYSVRKSQDPEDPDYKVYRPKTKTLKDESIILPYEDVNAWLNPNLRNSIENRNSTNQNTKTNVGESGVKW